MDVTRIPQMELAWVCREFSSPPQDGCGVPGGGREEGVACGFSQLEAGGLWVRTLSLGQRAVLGECFLLMASSVRKLAQQAPSQKFRFHLQSYSTQASSLPGICALQNCEDLKTKWIANSKENRKFSIFVLKKKKKSGAVKCENTSFSN